jgi:type IV pilus assembly protein PilE
METPSRPTTIAQAPGHQRRRGFTLIELMIALVIVAVLAVVALPSFMTQMRKARRAEAITELYRVSQAQERARAVNPTYSSNLGSGAANTIPLNLVATANATSYNMANGYYSVAVTTANTSASRYTLVATATGSMLSDTACRRLEFDMSAGVITYRSYTSAPVENTGTANLRCWNR